MTFFTKNTINKSIEIRNFEFRIIVKYTMNYPFRTLKLSIILIFYSLTLFSQSNPILIVIDPGHGGKDPGNLATSDSYYNEKNLNLMIALKLGEYLTDNLDNVEVVYTRQADIFVDLDDRVDLANQNNADYFISIHCNYSPKPHVNGTSTHIHSTDLKASYELAQSIENDFVTRAKRNSLGVFDANKRGRNLYVVQHTKMPSVLIECGFMSNTKEEKYLNSSEGQAYIASAIYRGVKKFIQNNHTVVDDRSTVYRVQISASKNPIYLNSHEFQKLDLRVEEYVFENQNYKYKYYVGWEYDLQSAKDIMYEVQKLGFPDAFIVKFDN